MFFFFHLLCSVACDSVVGRRHRSRGRVGEFELGNGEWGTGNGVEGPAYKTLTAVRRLVPRSGARERCHEEKQRPVSQDWP
jgi:hypothetical protein